MSKYVIKSNEAKKVSKKYVIPPPKLAYPKLSEVEKQKEKEVEEKKLTEDDVKRIKEEIDNLRAQWYEEQKKIKEEAEQEAQKIIKQAEDLAFAKIKESKIKAKEEIEKAKIEADKIINDAKIEANKIIDEAKSNAQHIVDENIEKGYKEGYEKGYAEGFEEAKRLIERLHIIISEILKKRDEIIEGTEQQIIELVLLIAKKVIKVLTEHQKTVVINNIIEALKKVKNSKKIIIRVNIDDLPLATKHKREFIELVEGLEEIQFVEDSTVDKGGCIIETDFGEIDARITIQLQEIENRILELIPVKKRNQLEVERENS